MKYIFWSVLRESMSSGEEREVQVFKFCFSFGNTNLIRHLLQKYIFALSDLVYVLCMDKYNVKPHHAHPNEQKRTLQLFQ